MIASAEANRARPIHPLYAFLLAGAVPLFLGGLLSDLAYASSQQIQWSNFAAWLIAGGMVFAGFALLWAFIALLRGRQSRMRLLIPFLLLLAVFVLGLIDSFVHARDAWGMMPGGLVLSVMVTAIMIAATWIGLSTFRPGGRK